MQKTVEEINPTKRRFVVEVPAEEIEQRINKALNDLRQRVRIPGFRPGKAPISLIEKRYGAEVERDVLGEIIPEYYRRAIEEENVVPLSAPVFEDYEYSRKSPLKMTFTVEIRPQVSELKYEGFTVKDEKIEVSDEDLDFAMQRLQTEKATYAVVDREVRDNDIVVIDYEIIEEKKALQNQVVQIGSELIPDELSNALTGKKKGDSFEVTVNFPEDYINKNLAGKELTLKGVIKEVKEVRKPELNDQFAKDLGYEDLQKLREAVRDALGKVRLQRLRDEQKAEVIEQLLQSNEIDLPEGMLENELNQLVSEKKAQQQDADEAALREELREEAEKNVKLTLLLDMIADREGIELTEEEIKKRILEMSAEMYVAPEVFMQMYLPDRDAFVNFVNALRRERALEIVLDRAEKKMTEEESDE